MKSETLTFKGYSHQQAVNSMIRFLEKEGYTVTKKTRGKTEIISKNRTCATCGKPAIEMQGETNGVDWHLIKCLSDDKTHTKWLSDEGK